MAETVCPGILDRGTEFVVAFDAAGVSQRRFGTCGQRASASALSQALNRVVSTADVYHRMSLLRLNADDASGASYAYNLRRICEVFGAVVLGDYHDYTSDSWPGWLDFARRHAGHDPMVLQTSEGWVLHDLISGLGENANVDGTSPQRLRYHYFAVLGYHSGGQSARAGGRELPEGFWCADGDNYAGGNSSANGFNAANVLQFYALANVQAAGICAGFALKGWGEQQHMAWHRQPDKSGKDDHGNDCGEGMMDEIERAGITANGRRGETYRDDIAPVRSFLTLENGQTVTWDGHSVGYDGASVIEGLLRTNASLASDNATLKAHQADPLAEEALHVAEAEKALDAKLP